MIVVKVELHSAITGKVSEIGRMEICNDGSSSDPKRGNYVAHVLRRGCTAAKKIVQRHGSVKDYPRLSYSVWRLVLRSLRSAFPEEV